MKKILVRNWNRIAENHRLFLRIPAEELGEESGWRKRWNLDGAGRDQSGKTSGGFN